MRYKVELSYNGNDFCGWQKQPNVITVQQTIEAAFELLFKDKIELVGCGRTDTGVHAKYFVAHFDSEISYSAQHLCKLNRFLPYSIAIFAIMPTSTDFHARFSAKNRTYEYFINTTKNPFINNFSWFIPQKIDVSKMQHAANQLFRYVDFTSFSKLHTDVKTNNCTILCAEFIASGGQLVFRISADRFLRNMVRAIVGTLVEVGKGKLSETDFCAIIEAKNRNNAGQSAPANALFLVNCEY
jgi:tRNA pseudouridine38-40 synthase